MVHGVETRLFLSTLAALVSGYLLCVFLPLPFAAFGGVGVFLFLSFLLHRKITRPLRQLLAAVVAAEKKNPQAPLDLGARDELGRLSRHWGHLLERVQKTEEENRKLAARLDLLSGELEVKVTQATQDLLEKNAELLRLQREIIRVGPLAALGQITGAIAHELGTPLNSVLGYTQLLLQEDLPEKAKHRLRIIESQVQRMTHTIEYYLSEVRTSRRQYRPVPINDLVRETLTLLEPLFQRHGVQVEVSLDESVPLILADSASLQRLLINLLNNAVDAMEEGGKVTVLTHATFPPECGRSGLVLEVQDTGSGIAPELLPRIFDLFVTTKPPGEGTGLGLAICQEIVRAHGGSIGVTSRVGEGTCVQVFLPAAEKAARFLEQPGKER